MRAHEVREGIEECEIAVAGKGATTERIQGKIKWFSHQKRYGFIQRADGLDDVFVHMNEFRVKQDAYWAKRGDAVEFTMEQTSKGTSATDVVILPAS